MKKVVTSPKDAFIRSASLVCVVVIACTALSLLEHLGSGIVRELISCLIPFLVGYSLGRIFGR